jgi:hypothetical protein
VRVRRTETEAVKSPLSKAEVKNMWRYSFIPPYTFMAYTWKNLLLPFTRAYFTRAPPRALDSLLSEFNQ